MHTSPNCDSQTGKPTSYAWYELVPNLLERLGARVIAAETDPERRRGAGAALRAVDCGCFQVAVTLAKLAPDDIAT